KLTTDPTLSRGIRVRLGLLMAYLALPVDMIPDSSPLRATPTTPSWSLPSCAASSSGSGSSHCGQTGRDPGRLRRALPPCQSPAEVLIDRTGHNRPLWPVLARVDVGEPEEAPNVGPLNPSRGSRRLVSHQPNHRRSWYAYRPWVWPEY